MHNINSSLTFLKYNVYKMCLGAYSTLFYGHNLSVNNSLFTYSTCLPSILERIYQKTSFKSQIKSSDREEISPTIASKALYLIVRL
jgi:hypothetical protein